MIGRRKDWKPKTAALDNTSSFKDKLEFFWRTSHNAIPRRCLLQLYITQAMISMVCRISLLNKIFYVLFYIANRTIHIRRTSLLWIILTPPMQKAAWLISKDIKHLLLALYPKRKSCLSKGALHTHYGKRWNLYSLAV